MRTKDESRFRIKIIEPKHKYLKCVYLIKIGRLRYIGLTNCLYERANSHEAAINKEIKEYAFVRNLSMDESDKRKEDKAKTRRNYAKIAQYILENPRVTFGTIEVLTHQQCSNMLALTEKYYISEFKSNPDCYNISDGLDHMMYDLENRWAAKVVGDRVVYYDYNAPQFSVSDQSDYQDFKKERKRLDEHKGTVDYKRRFLYDRINRLKELDPQNKDWVKRVITEGFAELKKLDDQR